MIDLNFVKTTLQELDRVIEAVGEDDVTLAVSLRYAKQMVKKQRPTPVKRKEHIGTYRNIPIYCGRCPFCKNAVASVSCRKVCDECGQALDWN